MQPNNENNVTRITRTYTRRSNSRIEDGMRRLAVGSSNTPLPTATVSTLGSMGNATSPLAFGQNSLFSGGIEIHQQQHPSDPTLIVESSEKLQEELKEFGLKIKHHEENIKYLIALGHKLDDIITECSIAHGKIGSTNTVLGENGETEELIIENILKYKNSASALICRMKYKVDMPDHLLLNDVIGVVAMLGKTDDARLSSMLSEYLGPEIMLSVVCKTSEGVKALESFNKDGVMGISLDEPFPVICLDNLRSYPGRFMDDDADRRLDLVKPIINGETPTGFLGFAVNMVFIDNSNMYCMSKAGNTLRETLFYNLFSSLQVYRSRDDMIKAQPFISNGAVSLDGGMIRKNGIVVMGNQKKDIDIKFPVRSRRSIRAEDFLETEKRLNETTYEKRRSLEDLQREREYLDHAKCNFKLKQTEIINVLANKSPYATQVGRASTSH